MISRTNTSSEYVYHPINALHLIKRIAKWMPKMKKIIPNLSFQYDFQSLLDEYTRALHGIADLVEYHDLDYNEISNGKIKDILNNKTYVSKSPLSCEELLKIAHEAKLVNYMDGHVNWLVAALKKAKLENRNKKLIKTIRYLLLYTI